MYNVQCSMFNYGFPALLCYYTCLAYAAPHRLQRMAGEKDGGVSIGVKIEINVLHYSKIKEI